MPKEYFNVIVVDKDQENEDQLNKIFNNLRMIVKPVFLYDFNYFMESLTETNYTFPEMILLNYDYLQHNTFDDLKKIQSHPKLESVITVIYSGNFSEKEIEDLFIQGANIVINKPKKYEELNIVVTEMLTIAWQYHTSGMDKENFIMKL